MRSLCLFFFHGNTLWGEIWREEDVEKSPPLSSAVMSREKKQKAHQFSPLSLLPLFLRALSVGASLLRQQQKERGKEEKIESLFPSPSLHFPSNWRLDRLIGLKRDRGKKRSPKNERKQGRRYVGVGLIFALARNFFFPCCRPHLSRNN